MTASVLAYTDERLPTSTMNKTKIGYACDHPNCNRVFKSAPALRMHKLRGHGPGWDTTENLKNDGHRNKAGKLYPSSTKAYKRRKYLERVAWNHARGLNAHGEPLKTRPLTASEAMKASWARRKAAKNGILIQPKQAEADPLADAAKAILLAAKVLRGTMHSLRLPLVIAAALWMIGCSKPAAEAAEGPDILKQGNCYQAAVDKGMAHNLAWDQCFGIYSAPKPPHYEWVPDYPSKDLTRASFHRVRRP